jgi:hypothetical protein
MKRKLIWAAIVVPAGFYLLAFLREGLAAYTGTMPPEPGAGLTANLHYFFAVKFEVLETQVASGLTVLVALAVGLGIINLVGVHGATLLRKRPGWPLSLLIFVSFAVVSGALLWQYRIDTERRALLSRTDAAWGRLATAQKIEAVNERDTALAAITPEDWALIRARSGYEDAYRFEPRQFYVNAIRLPLETTVMSLLGFYLTYAAYRAFRIRSLEATFMMLSAAVVILGSDAFGGWLTNGVLTRVAEFDNGVLNSGMQRGLLLGIGVATIAASLRILLGLERGVIEVRQDQG